MKQLMAPSYCRFTLPPPPVETQGFMDSSPALNHLTNCPLKTHLFVYLMLSQTSNLYTCAVFIIQNYTDQLIPHHYQSSLASSWAKTVCWMKTILMYAKVVEMWTTQCVKLRMDHPVHLFLHKASKTWALEGEASKKQSGLNRKGGGEEIQL